MEAAPGAIRIIVFAANSAWNILNFRMNLVRALLAEGLNPVALVPPGEGEAELRKAGGRGAHDPDGAGRYVASVGLPACRPLHPGPSPYQAGRVPRLYAQTEHLRLDGRVSARHTGREQRHRARNRVHSWWGPGEAGAQPLSGGAALFASCLLPQSTANHSGDTRTAARAARNFHRAATTLDAMLAIARLRELGEDKLARLKALSSVYRWQSFLYQSGGSVPAYLKVVPLLARERMLLRESARFARYPASRACKVRTARERRPPVPPGYGQRPYPILRASCRAPQCRL